ncbi:homocysteine S-methyltransferase family protein [Aquibaculum sediminis]|uniref:homocysteine S-methyltransferase family protein n=1 Tax=Aquibaculum sediminis TaxID=3231907 RepID=UPI003457258C
MAKYRAELPQMQSVPFLTDAGLETTLIFHDGLDLAYFAAFTLLRDEAGRETLRRYFRQHAEIALDKKAGFILESATWRASPDWAEKLGYSPEDLDEANRQAIEMLLDLRNELENDTSPMVVSGCLGPRGDGYDPGQVMTPEEAQAYHAHQMRVFADSGADMATAITMTNTPEAIGLVRAAQAEGMPVAISFTTETDGRLPTGESLGEAIAAVDAATQAGPVYYMVNCAHPSHFAGALEDALWMERVRGLRCNASKRSHAELDQAEDLDAGDPLELGQDYAGLCRRFPQLTVLGGCCGTDHRHIEAIGRACLVTA